MLRDGIQKQGPHLVTVSLFVSFFEQAVYVFVYNQTPEVISGRGRH